MSNSMQTEMLDPFAARDIFVSGLGEIEHLGGGVYRFTFFSRQHIGESDALVIVAKIIVPIEAVPGMMRRAAKELGLCACETIARGVTVN